MMNKMNISKFSVFILSCFFLSGNVHAQTAGNLTLEIEGLRNREGQVCLNVFSASRGFPNDPEKALKKQCFKITEIPLTVTIEGLNFGSYAVAAYHDENGEQKLNRGTLGIPTEAFGFSNNPFISTGPAKYRDAVFIVAGQNISLKIIMKYSVNR